MAVGYRRTRATGLLIMLREQRISVCCVLSVERGFAGVGVVLAGCDAGEVEEMLAFGADAAAGHDQQNARKDHQ